MLSGVAQLHQQRRFGRQSVRNAERAEWCLIDTHLLSRLKHQLVGNSVEKCWEKWQGSGELYIRSQTMQNVTCLHVGEGVLYTFLSFVSSKDDAASTWVTLEKKQILESVASGLGSDLLNQTNPPPSFLLPWHLTLPRRGASVFTASDTALFLVAGAEPSPGGGRAQESSERGAGGRGL